MLIGEIYSSVKAGSTENGSATLTSGEGKLTSGYTVVSIATAEAASLSTTVASVSLETGPLRELGVAPAGAEGVVAVALSVVAAGLVVSGFAVSVTGASTSTASSSAYIAFPSVSIYSLGLDPTVKTLTTFSGVEDFSVAPRLTTYLPAKGWTGIFVSSDSFFRAAILAASISLSFLILPANVLRKIFASLGPFSFS